MSLLLVVHPRGQTFVPCHIVRPLGSWTYKSVLQNLGHEKSGCMANTVYTGRGVLVERTGANAIALCTSGSFRYGSQKTANWSIFYV